MTEQRTYVHQHPYRGFFVATFTDNGKAVGSYGDSPIFARYYVLDEFEQNVVPLDQWHWSPVDAFAAIDAICTNNPTLDPKKWKGVYDRIGEYRRLSRFTPYAIEALTALREASSEWPFNSGDECEADLHKHLDLLFTHLKTVGPVPREMF
jgi:hypothetical protein